MNSLAVSLCARVDDLLGARNPFHPDGWRPTAQSRSVCDNVFARASNHRACRCNGGVPARQQRRRLQPLRVKRLKPATPPPFTGLPCCTLRPQSMCERLAIRGPVSALSGPPTKARRFCFPWMAIAKTLCEFISSSAASPIGTWAGARAQSRSPGLAACSYCKLWLCKLCSCCDPSLQGCSEESRRHFSIFFLFDYIKIDRVIFQLHRWLIQ